MKIVEVKKDYINYLRNFDKFVLKSEGEDYKKERKYIGVVLSCNSFDYFIPFSSPDRKDDYEKDGSIRKSSSVVIRMTEQTQEKEKLLGTLRLNSMIPIPNKNLLNNYDIAEEKDYFYKNLLFKELNFIKKNEAKIINKAEKLYDLKISNSKLKVVHYVCDFKLLEEKALEYTKMLEIKQQKKQNQKEVNQWLTKDSVEIVALPKVLPLRLQGENYIIKQTSIKVVDNVWQEFQLFAKSNKTYSSIEYLSLALIEFLEKHRC